MFFLIQNIKIHNVQTKLIEQNIAEPWIHNFDQ